VPHGKAQRRQYEIGAKYKMFEFEEVHEGLSRLCWMVADFIPVLGHS
jgi:hypothetical protein